MAAQLLFQTMPNFQNMQFVDPKTGNLTPEWSLLMSQLMQALQSNVSTQGLVMPSQSAANITQIQTALTSAPPAFGTLIYNTDTNKGMLNEAGTFKTIVTV